MVKRTNVVRVALVVATFALASSAAAQEREVATEERSDEAGAIESPETGICIGGDAVLDVGTVITEDVNVPCWAEFDSCKGAYVVNLGDVWVGRDGQTEFSSADAYYENGECGYGAFVGQLTRSDNLYLYVGNATGLVRNYSASTIGVKVEMWIDDYVCYDCSSSCWLRYWYEADFCGLPAPDGSKHHALAGGGIGDCGASDIDLPACGMPDWWIAGSSVGSFDQHSYKVEIRSSVCNQDGTNCRMTRYQTGCFDVYWHG